MGHGSESSVFDRQGMLERLGDDEELLCEILEVFRHEYPRMLEAAREAVRSADANAVERAGHTLKGALLNISAQDAAAAARDFEQSGRSGVLDQRAELLDRLESALERLAGELAAGDVAPQVIG